MRKVVLLIVLLGCALGALVLWLARNSRKEAVPGAPQVVEPVAPPGRRALDVPGSAGELAKVAPRQPRASEAPSVEPPARALELGGRIVVIDASEVEHAHESGFLAFTLQSGESRSHHEIVVQDGQWSAAGARAAPDAEVEMLRAGVCVLGGRRAVPEPRAALAVPADGRVDLRLRWLPAPRLHVRARDTGRELEEVFLCELPAVALGSAEDGERPGAELLLTAHAVGPSPVQLEESRDPLAPRVLFARGEGHAWGRILIDEEEAEPTLLLDPAGELELVVQGEPEKRWAQIELVSAAQRDGRSYRYVTLGERETLVLQDLPAGRYTAQARSQGWPLGSIDVEVLAGERVTAILEVGLPSTRLVPLEGILELPEEWNEVGDRDTAGLAFGLTDRRNNGASFSISSSFRILRSEMVSEEGARRLHWAAPAVRPGRYRVDLLRFQFTTDLDTGPDGTRTALISVPGLDQVAVRCVDEQGSEVTSEGIGFASLTPRNFGSWYCAGYQGRYSNPQRFEVHQGPTLLFTRANLYEQAVRVLDVGPGTNEVVFYLRAR